MQPASTIWTNALFDFKDHGEWYIGIPVWLSWHNIFQFHLLLQLAPIVITVQHHELANSVSENYQNQ